MKGYGGEDLTFRKDLDALTQLCRHPMALRSELKIMQIGDAHLLRVRRASGERNVVMGRSPAPDAFSGALAKSVSFRDDEERQLRNALKLLHFEGLL